MECGDGYNYRIENQKFGEFDAGKIVTGIFLMKKCVCTVMLVFIASGWSAGISEYDFCKCTVPGFTYDVEIYNWILREGNFATAIPYALVSSDSGFGVVDISQPHNPVLKSFLSLPGYGHELAVSGTYAYVTDGTEKAVQIVDISNLDNLQTAGSIGDSCGYVWGLDLVTDTTGEATRICAVGSVRGMTWYDVSNPSNCSKMGEYSPYSGLLSEVSPEISFRDYDLKNTSEGRDTSVRYYPFDSCYPPMEDERAMVRKTDDVEIIGDTAYLLYYDNTECGSGLYLKKIDISLPEAPRCLDSTGCFGWGCGFTVTGNDVYVAHVQGVDSYSCSGLDLKRYFKWGVRKEDVVVENGNAYVACNFMGVFIIDVSDQDTMILREMVGVPGNSYGIALNSGSMYVASGDSGLCIFSDVVKTIQKKTFFNRGSRIIDRIVTGRGNIRLFLDRMVLYPVEIRLYDMKGHLLNSLLTDRKECTFEHLNRSGNRLPFGMYLLQVKSGNEYMTRRISFVR
jgi:hypothetical protein